MYSFRNDYSEGAHPKVLQALTESNLRQTRGYGLDPCCQEAADLLRQLCAAPEAEPHFLTGGTQTNLLAIEALTKPYEAVLCAKTGHINVHETGAVEATGRKIIALPSPDGKVTPAMVESVPELRGDEHMVKPALVYISDTTETGTAYTPPELTALRRCCDAHGLRLYLDGARLPSALACSALTLPDLPRLTDAFSFGGTKSGLLFGEALIFSRPCPDFRWYMKRRGAMLAKGRLLGVQFRALLTDGLYLDLARHANAMARRLREGMTALGCPPAWESPSNQQFFVLPNEAIAALQVLGYEFEEDAPVDATHTRIRLVTSWATPPEAAETFLADAAKVLG